MGNSKGDTRSLGYSSNGTQCLAFFENHALVSLEYYFLGETIAPNV